MRATRQSTRSIAAMMLLPFTIIALPATAVAASGSGSDGRGSDRSDSGSGQGSAIIGRGLFVRENCAICHGGRAGGGMAPSLRDRRPSENKVVDAVLNGRPTGMPSYRPRLTEQDALHLAAYVNSLRRPEEPVFTHWWEVVPGCVEVQVTGCADAVPPFAVR